METKISKDLLESYEKQTLSKEWRELEAKYKAKNIITLCKGSHFNKVLDCGAGEGSIMEILHQSTLFGDFYAVEITKSATSLLEKRSLPRLKEIKHFDGYAIPYPDDTFDLVYCSHVIEHVEHPRLLLREIKRVSKRQLFEVPLDYFNGVDKELDHFLGYGHVNIYTPSLFRFLLKSEGFIIVNDLLTDLPAEVSTYIKLKVSIFNRLKKKIARRILSKEKMNEFTYQRYACLTQSSTKPKIIA